MIFEGGVSNYFANCFPKIRFGTNYVTQIFTSHFTGHYLRNLPRKKEKHWLDTLPPHVIKKITPNATPTRFKS